MKILFQSIIILLIVVSGITPPEDYHNPERELQSILKEYPADSGDLSIIIDKSGYRLSVKYDTVVLKEYPVVFGRNSVGDKLRQGDKCTPEGTFFMKDKYPHSKWSKFIWLNYPTDESWRKHNLAIQQGKIPANSKIGGEIGIHGVPADMDYLIDLRYNWTEGCISMKNKDIEEIYRCISKSTPIIIQK